MKIDTDLIRGNSDSLKEYIDNIRNESDSLQDKISKSNDSLKGERIDKGYNISMNFIDEVTDLIEKMEGFVTFLNGVAGSYDLLDEDYSNKTIDV